MIESMHGLTLSKLYIQYRFAKWIKNPQRKSSTFLAKVFESDGGPLLREYDLEIFEFSPIRFVAMCRAKGVHWHGER